MLRGFVKNRYTPVLIAGIGILIQLVLFKIGLKNNLMSQIWFLLPVVGIAGMVIAAVQWKRVKGILPIIGFAINLIWFLAYAYLFYVVTVVNW